MIQQKTAELISNGLSIPMLMLCVAVVVMWHRAAMTSFKASRKACEDWFIIGVYIGFLGECMDSLYWLITWSFSYVGSEYTQTLVSRGVFYNIPFRQVFGAIAAYCHIRSAIAYRNEEKPLNIFLGVGLVAGFFYALILVFIRGINL